MSAADGKARQVGRIAGGLAVLFLLFDATGKLFTVRQVVAGTLALGWPETAIVGIGIVELACVVAFVIPRTAVLGAILLTGYLGGAVATHVRIGDPLFSHVLFPTYVAAVLWLSLYLRDARLRALVPLRD